LPSNVYMPDQVEFGFFHFSKSPYRIEIPGDRRVTFVAISARVAIVDLLGGTAPQNAVIREVGAERGIAVPHPGPFTRDVASDLGLSNDLTVQLYDTPDGADLQAASAAVILEDGRERIVGYDTRGDLPLRATEFELATRAPSGDLGDAENIAVGTCVDSSAAREWSLGIFDRSGFTPPYTAVFDSWMRVPELERSGHLYRWSDPTNPGSSPSPTWTRSNLGLRPIDPTDSTVAITVDWRIYTRAYPRRFNLPVLPAIAPVPPGGLPDPGATPDEDQLYWFFVAVNSPGDTQSILRDFMQDGTHWVSHWMPLEPDQAIEPAEESVPRLLLEAAPRPTFGLVRFTWTQPAAGDGSLTIVGCDGRPVIRVPVDLGRGVHVWNGRDAQGRRAPGGVYWATLSGHDQPPARIRILRLE
jgi:hypothetical protein